MAISKTQFELFKEGYDGYERGLAAEDNPYNEDSDDEAHGWWYFGWYYAQARVTEPDLAM